MMKTYHFYKDANGNMHSVEQQSEFELQNLDSSDEREAFTERTDINQFLRDGAVINALYDVTLQHLFENQTRNVEERVLEVFNKAYKICWMITSQDASYSDILHNVIGKRPNLLVRDLSQFVAWSILKVYNGFYSFDDSIIDTLRIRTQNKNLFSSYRELVRMQDDPCRPICFDTPGIRPSRHEFCIDGMEIQPDDAKSVWEFLGNYAAHHSNLESDEEEDEEYEMRPIDDVLEKSFSVIRSTYDAIKNENKRLAFAMAEMESNQRKAIEGMEATISRLRSQNAHLTKQLESKKSEVKVKEVIKENPLQKILNWDTITNYALGLGNYKDVQVLCNMFNRMSSRNQYYNQNLMENIDKLEAYIRDLQKPVVNQTNQGCQQFYGEVRDSEFKTSKPNE